MKYDASDLLHACLLSACLPLTLTAQSLAFYGNLETQYLGLLNQQSYNNSSVQSEHQSTRLAVTLAELGFTAPVTASWQIRAEVQQGRSDRSQLGIAMQQLPPGTSSAVLWSDEAPEGSKVFWSRAEACYRAGEQTYVKLGLVRLPEITSERSYYKPYLGSFATNRTIGGFLTNQGRHAGLALESVAENWHYQLAFWQQTYHHALDYLPTENIAPAAGVDNAASLEQFTSSYSTGVNAQSQAVPEAAIISARAFDKNGLLAGLLSRVSYHQTLPGGLGSYAFGIGGALAPLNQPIVVNTIAEFQDGSHGATYSGTMFNTLAQCAVDASVVLSHIQINMGYQAQNLRQDVSQFFTTGTAFGKPGAAFLNSGQTSSLWVETGCLFGLASYSFFDQYGAIAGINLKERHLAFELTGRYGMEHYRNVSALIEQQGFSDFNTDKASPSIAIARQQSLSPGQQVTVFNIDNTTAGARQITEQDGCSYEFKRTGWQLTGALYFSSEFCIRLQYQSIVQNYRKSYDGQPRDHAWSNSINAHKVSTIRFGGQYAF